MARNKHSDKDRPRPPDVQQADVQKASGGYSATEQGDRRRAREQPDPNTAPSPDTPGPDAPGQEAERGAHDPGPESRRQDQPGRKPRARPKARPKGP